MHSSNYFIIGYLAHYIIGYFIKRYVYDMRIGNAGYGVMPAFVFMLLARLAVMDGPWYGSLYYGLWLNASLAFWWTVVALPVIHPRWFSRYEEKGKLP